MKTGSTAFQRCLGYNRRALKKRGCVAYQFSNPKGLLNKKRKKGNDTVLARVYSAFDMPENKIIIFCCEHLAAIHDPTTLDWLTKFRERSNIIIWTIVKRPLVYLYPSPYLQNIQGSMRRTSTFEEFGDEQIEIDSRLCWMRNCTTFNYAYILKRLKKNWEGVKLELLNINVAVWQWISLTLVGQAMA